MKINVTSCAVANALCIMLYYKTNVFACIATYICDNERIKFFLEEKSISEKATMYSSFPVNE